MNDIYIYLFIHNININLAYIDISRQIFLDIYMTLVIHQPDLALALAEAELINN